jgi:membrane protein YdbS with pleckstrin-like domain
MIQPNTQSKLSGSVLTYWLFKALFLPIILCVFMMFATTQVTVDGVVTNLSVMAQFGVFAVFGIPVALFVILAIYQILYFNAFSFAVNEGQISITSGVLFSSTKTTDFRMVQNVASARGPILAMFGLSALRGFTSSPDQIHVSGGSFELGGRGGSRTTYRPDINMLLPVADAEQLRAQIATVAETPNVHVV